MNHNGTEIARKSNSVLMFSGGLDSLIAWYYLNKPKVVHAYLGHRYGAAEYLATMRLAKKLGMDLVMERRLFLGDKETPDAYIPMRNLFLATLGALHGDTIYMVFQKGEQALPDRSPRFLAMASELLTFLNGRPIVVDSPFLEMTKSAMIKWYLDHGHPEDVLYESFSCFDTNVRGACGQCAACFRRWIAFKNNGLPLEFRVDITKWSGIQEYIRKIKLNEYALPRAREIETVLRRYGLWK